MAMDRVRHNQAPLASMHDPAARPVPRVRLQSLHRPKTCSPPSSSRKTGTCTSVRLRARGPQGHPQYSRPYSHAVRSPFSALHHDHRRARHSAQGQSVIAASYHIDLSTPISPLARAAFLLSSVHTRHTPSSSIVVVVSAPHPCRRKCTATIDPSCQPEQARVRQAPCRLRLPILGRHPRPGPTAGHRWPPSAPQGVTTLRQVRHQAAQEHRAPIQPPRPPRRPVWPTYWTLFDMSLTSSVGKQHHSRTSGMTLNIGVSRRGGQQSIAHG